MACSSTKKKSSSIVQRSIGILTVILVVLIVAMMMIVSSIQGTARIVNYAGLVRGKTQRIVKFEISGKQEDDMIQEIESFIDGLRNGNKELNLVRLDDSDFQAKMEELNEYFLMLKQEITGSRRPRRSPPPGRRSAGRPVPPCSPAGRRSDGQQGL